MAQGAWREEVAKLLEQCAAATRSNMDRQAAAALGTAIGYLQRAESKGDLGAKGLLAQARNTYHDENTQRFSFAPGELEELTGAGNLKVYTPPGSATGASGIPAPRTRPVGTSVVPAPAKLAAGARPVSAKTSPSGK